MVILKHYSALVINTKKIVVASLGVILSKPGPDIAIFILFMDVSLSG